MEFIIRREAGIMAEAQSLWDPLDSEDGTIG